jgi:ribonuclease BN (tRNA processing enzyme)
MTSPKASDLLVLGSASPLLPGRSWSSFLVGGHILLEAPPMMPQRLHELGINPLDIDIIVISHLHGDHFAGLPFLLLEYDVITQRTAPLTVVGPAGLQARIEALFENYYPGWAQEVDRPYDCTFHEMSSGEKVRMGEVVLSAVEVDHGLDEGQALGFVIEGSRGRIGFSGDTRLSEAIFLLAQDADILILDCTHANYVEGATHLSLPEVFSLRAQISPTTEIVLTHQGAPYPAILPAGIRAPVDGERLQFRSKVDEGPR